ncbi:MAG: M48 family metallopeptidase [Muribaculaceae bacterium]|nr:M48 family metallopeptidase [Muribaculaceae bacterium]
MKKILCVLMLSLIPLSAFAGSSYLDAQLKDVDNNMRYNTVKKYSRSYQQWSVKTRNIQNLKDPGLIKLSSAEKISDADYKAKLAKDEEVYKKLKPKLKAYNEVEYYSVYRVAERLVRANNLDYVNWRIAVRKTVDTVNAYANNGNFVCIFTALYDSVSSNEDALAFVLAHEMAHNILGHTQRRYEHAHRTAHLRSTVGSFYRDSRKMEYMADAEAFILLYKAGYSPQKAMETLYVLDAMPQVKTIYASHPMTKKRIQSAYANIKVLDPNWVDVGRYNIYNSDVIVGKKSGDRVSFVMDKAKKVKEFYQPENYEQRLTRMAYVSYLNGNMEDAAKWFSKLAKESGKYEHYLYLSYAQQYLYDFTKKSSHLKKAVTAAENAYQYASNDKNVKAQYDEVTSLANSLQL